MVYFIQGEHTGLIKIGKANDVLARLKALQSGSPDRLKVMRVLPDAKADRGYHKQFRSAWAHGEWFRPSADLLTFIAAIPASKWDGLVFTSQDWAIHHRVTHWSRVSAKQWMAMRIARNQQGLAPR